MASTATLFPVPPALVPTLTAAHSFISNIDTVSASSANGVMTMVIKTMAVNKESSSAGHFQLFRESKTTKANSPSAARRSADRKPSTTGKRFGSKYSGAFVARKMVMALKNIRANLSYIKRSKV